MVEEDQLLGLYFATCMHVHVLLCWYYDTVHVDICLPSMQNVAGSNPT